MDKLGLDSIERQIQRGFRWLRFMPEIEAGYRQEFAEHRIRRAPLWAVVGTVIYDLVFFGDATMVPDQLHALIFARFAIFTPFAILATALVLKWRSARNYDLLSLAVVLLGGSLPMLVAMHSTSEHLFIYQTGNVATFLFLVVGLRPRFPAVLSGLVSLCAIHLTLCAQIPSFGEISYQGLVTFYITISIFLALGAYFQEHADRMNYLNRIRATSLHRQLEVQSERDELTGLLNRRSLARVERELWQFDQSRSVSVIMLDIDRFKLFNDVHGHLDGDDCIRAVARTIVTTADDRSTVFRFGGEEILIVTPDIGCDEAAVMAERIRRAIETLAIPHRGLTPSGVVTASLGVACGQTHDVSLQDLLRRADQALYDAKKLGRNRVSTGNVCLQRIS
ncbi:GGDEF domain-containing protein [Rhizobium sp. AQ_MP]|uniref:GGDEF domain-containing protein n=1 Tax=Rhizobium sp. AQ_MP TaxID=2761536 RepID=UPI00163AB335|nr:GGDEF domain-containing protein [Rhizobium sp. AQ_MP]MBC2773749.1 GGDEF domain-containing protein [Rhizobium sp. AQ_MP]